MAMFRKRALPSLYAFTARLCCLPSMSSATSYSAEVAGWSDPVRKAPGAGSETPARHPPRSSRVEPLAFATAPALYAAMWLSAGILLEALCSRRAYVTPGVLLAAMVAMAAMTAITARKTMRLALLPLSLVWIFLGMLLCEIAPAPDAQTQLTLLAEKEAAVPVEGIVVRTNPIRRTVSELPYGNRTRIEQSESFDLRIDHAAGVPVRGGLRATVYAAIDEPFPPLACGDRVHARLAIHVPERYLDPGVWDAPAWLRQQGVGVIGSLKASAITLSHSAQPPTLTCRIHALQEAGSQRLLDFASSTASSHWPQWLLLNAIDAGMLSAMILGDRTYLEHQARVGFERTGSFHLLVVSGMHLAIFAGCIFALAARLRLARTGATILTIFCSFAYAMLAGFGEPVQRSFFMVTLYLLARLVFRERNSLNAVGFAALCLLALDPRALAGASFQMTLLSVLIAAGIALPVAEHTFAPYLQATRNLGLLAIDPSLPPKVAQFRVALRLVGEHLEPFFKLLLKPRLGRRLAQAVPAAAVRLLLRACELLLLSSLIELAMSLPMAIYFHRITALGLPVNLLVVPLIGVALPSALFTFFVLLLSPAAAIVPAALTAAVLHAITAVVQHFGAMSAGDIRIGSPAALPIVAAIFMMGTAVWCARNSRLPVLLSITALVCAAACVFYPQPLRHRPGVLEVTAIDVGQGDSLLLISPEGKTLLVDAGGPTGAAQAVHSNFEVGEDVVSPLLWSRHIRRLDAVVLSHAHSDHMGGLPAVLQNFRPRQLIVGKNPGIPAYVALLDEAAQLHIPVHSQAAGDRFNFGGALVEVLAPPSNYLPGAAASNDDSLVLRVTFGHTAVLLEGDAQTASEQRMRGEQLHADLLKVGHHGSKTSTTPPFLGAVSPSYAVISVAHRNSYGHPKWDTLDRLGKRHVRTFRTDEDGATTFYLDGNAVSTQ